VVFVSRLTFALEVLAGRQSPSGSTFPSTTHDCDSHAAGQVNVRKGRRALHERDRNQNKTVPVTAFR